MVKYLDANVFLYSALYNDLKSNNARKILESVAFGKSEAVTSILTMDEVLWKMWKETRDREIALKTVLDIKQFSKVKLLNVDMTIFNFALSFMSKYSFLKPRDAIHLATMFNLNIGEIISDDSDFDKIKEIKRIPLG